MESPEDLLTPEQAATLLSISAKTLKTWRKEQRGPALIRLGHRTVRYRRGTVQAWLKDLEKVLPSPRRDHLQIPAQSSPA